MKNNWYTLYICNIIHKKKCHVTNKCICKKIIFKINENIKKEKKKIFFYYKKFCAIFYFLKLIIIIFFKIRKKKNIYIYILKR